MQGNENLEIGDKCADDQILIFRSYSVDTSRSREKMCTGTQRLAHYAYSRGSTRLPGYAYLLMNQPSKVQRP